MLTISAQSNNICCTSILLDISGRIISLSRIGLYNFLNNNHNTLVYLRTSHCFPSLAVIYYFLNSDASESQRRPLFSLVRTCFLLPCLETLFGIVPLNKAIIFIMQHIEPILVHWDKSLIQTFQPRLNATTGRMHET